MFNVQYDSKTGIIKSYQEGPDATPDEEIASGCKLVYFGTVPNIFSASGSITHKIDIATGELVSLVSMPSPIK